MISTTYSLYCMWRTATRGIRNLNHASEGMHADNNIQQAFLKKKALICVNISDGRIPFSHFSFRVLVLLPVPATSQGHRQCHLSFYICFREHRTKTHNQILYTTRMLRNTIKGLFTSVIKNEVKKNTNIIVFKAKSTIQSVNCYSHRIQQTNIRNTYNQIYCTGTNSEC